MSDSISVENKSGQVAVIGLPSDDPKSMIRREIIDQRIARGELKVSKGKSGGRRQPRAVVEDYHTGLKDERGDLLKSVHGGGVDPDAKGDALGQPSGSEAVAGAVSNDAQPPQGDSHPDAAAEAPNKPVAKKAAAKQS